LFFRKTILIDCFLEKQVVYIVIMRFETAAVLTGDIVGSSALIKADREKLLRVLKSGSEKARQVFSPHVPMKISVFRGDSWQLLIMDPRVSLSAALFFRSYVRFKMDAKTDTRISIGIGSIEFLSPVSITESDGLAFRRSGDGLESMERKTRLRVRGPNQNSPFDVIAGLVDAIVSRWTASQSQAVFHAIQGRTQKESAEMWHPEPTTQQSVAQHMSRTSWLVIKDALEFFSNNVQQ